MKRKATDGQIAEAYLRTRAVSRAAKELGMHVNSIRARLKRLEIEIDWIAPGPPRRFDDDERKRRHAACARRWENKNRDRCRWLQRRSRQKRADQRRGEGRAYYWANRELMRSQSKTWQAANQRYVSDAMRNRRLARKIGASRNAKIDAAIEGNDD